MIREVAGPLAALALAMGVGAALLGACAGSARLSRPLHLALAFLAGAGVTSFTYPAWRLVLGRGPGAGYLAFDAALGIVLLLLGRALRRPGSPAEAAGDARPPGSGERRAAAALALGAALWCAAFAVTTWAQPHGEWDAWAIWNARARLLLRSPDAWQAFAVERMGHPTYPLLLPGAVARGWAWAGAETTVVPAVLALLFALAAVGVVAAGLAQLAGRSAGLLGALLLVGTWDWLREAPHQYADVPLAAYLVAAFALASLAERDRGGAPGPWAAAGLMLGLAAWTKNEGLLMLAVVALALATRARSMGPRGTLALAAGALAPIAALGAFKRAAPGGNYLFASRGPADFGRLALDPARWAVVGRWFASALVTFGGGMVLFVAAILLLLRARGAPLARSWRTRALGAMLGAYALVYAVTPLPLEEQLRTSLDRLLLQLWPAALFALLLDAQPWGAVAAGEPPGAAPAFQPGGAGAT